MVVVHILSETTKQAEEIVDFLIEQKLFVTAIIKEEIVYRKKNTTGFIKNSKRSLIMGRSKSLLFSTINEKLRKKYPKHMPILYSIPIVHMDPKQTEVLLNNTASI